MNEPAINKETIPFFSVVITTYNRAKLLNRALKSLWQQTETDFEIILVNDGSTDKTEQLVQQLLKTNKPITYLAQENKGFITGKNNGIVKAKGKYITFLDSDDEYKPQHLATRKALLQECHTIDFLHGGVAIIGDEFVPDANNPSQKIHLSECAISGTFFLKNDVMQMLNGFAGNALNTDADFMERALKANLTIRKTAVETYVYHRELGDSITKNISF